jgi:hypothetical protein
MGEGLAVCSSEMVDAHCVDEPVAEASMSRSSDVALKVWSLHMEWGTPSMHRQTNHTWVSEERL